MSLRRYTISTRTNEVLWQPRAGETGHRLPPGWEKQYEHEELVLSPDKRFLFMPWLVPAHKMLHILEYEVYHLQSGEKQGAFLNLLDGETFIEPLGWVENDTRGLSQHPPGEHAVRREGVNR